MSTHSSTKNNTLIFVCKKCGIELLENEEIKVFNNDKTQTIIPKIKVPEIQFHGVKIYIPKRFSKEREIVN